MPLRLLARSLVLALAVLMVGLVPQAAAQDPTAALDALLDATHAAGQLHGTVLAAQGDEVLYVRGFGEAERSWGVPNGPDTRFRIASVTKQFTAALVMQLAEEGLVDLDAPLTRALPDYPAAQGDRVTVHQLLSHTSGIPEHTGAEGFDAVMRDPVAPDSFLTLFSGRPLDFEPGSAYRYSNSGYFVLGVLIEHLTGQTYAEALDARLFEPLGLAATTYDDGAEILPRAARGYVQAGTGFAYADYLDPSVPYSAGMISSTAGDLHRWTRALHAAEPFERAETLGRMLTPVLGNYAYGIGVSDLPVGDAAVRMIGHSGGIPGFSSFVLYLPESERTVVVLDNTQGSAGDVAMNVARVLFGEAVEAPRPPVSGEMERVIEAEGIAAAEARYRALRAEGGTGFDLDENHLNALGYAYLQRGETATAVRVFGLNAEAFPESWNPHDSLGEAYVAAGDRDRAIASYRRALQLNPTATSARDALASLGDDAAVETVTVPVEALRGYVGRYAMQPGMTIEITLDGSTLSAEPTGRSAVELVPASATRFVAPDVGAEITFEVGADGRAQFLNISGGMPDMRGERVE